jgi:excisionase family DNA binding protein
MDQMPKYFSVKEVADQLRVTVDKVTDLIRTQKLNAFDVSLAAGSRARWRISETDLQDFLATRQSRPAEPVQPKSKSARMKPLPAADEITYY